MVKQTSKSAPRKSERTQLELSKLRAELWSSRIDWFSKPAQAITPIIIAVAAYILIQQPQQEQSRVSACLEQVQFMRGVVSKEANSDVAASIMSALKNFNFQCDAANAVATALQAQQRATSSLREAQEAVTTAEGLDYLNLAQSNDPETVCSVAQAPFFENQSQKLSDTQKDLEVRRQDTQSAIDGLRIQAEYEAITGRGPRYKSLLNDINALSAELKSLNAEISETHTQLNHLKETSLKIEALCSQ